MAKTYAHFTHPPFKFSLTPDAAAHNSAIIQKYDYNFPSTIAHTTPGTQLAPGSEFRPVGDLDELCHHHPLWPRARRLISEGCDIPMTHTPDPKAREDLILGIQRGNHKGAVNQPKALQALLEKDVVHGFSLPVELSTAK